MHDTTGQVNAVRPLSPFIVTMGACLSMAAAQDFRPQIAAFALSSDQAHPGDTLRGSLEFVNLGSAPADAEYTVFVHVRPHLPGYPDSQPATGGDFRPRLPTYCWKPGCLVAEDGVALAIPDAFPPGAYDILVGLYDPAAGRAEFANADLAAGNARYHVATLSIVAQDQPLQAQPIAQRWRETAGLPLAAEALSPPGGDATLVLSSPGLKVTLAADYPRVLAYGLASGAELLGDSSGFPIRVRVAREAEALSRLVVLRKAEAFTVTRTDSEARYTAHVPLDGESAATFDVVCRLEGNVLRVGVENIAERPGYLLLDVWLPQVAGARAPSGQLALPTQCGRLVHLDHSAPSQHTIGMNWFEMDLVGAVVGDGCVAAIRTRDWDNELTAQVLGRPGSVAGGFYPRLALRAEAAPPAARMRLAGSPGVEVALLTDEDGDGRATWVDAAYWIRRDLTYRTNPLYADTWIYKIFCDAQGAQDPTTFDDALKLIERVHNLAPWVKQIAYLVGWQYEGHDTGYPATDVINPRLGGPEGLAHLCAQAKRFDALVSYHDNFDDAYMTSPRWDESVIARDARGELQKGGVWAGGQSYILAFGMYAAGDGLARVRRTLAQMPVEESYHIDVLSAVPMRRDYNPASPESTLDSLAGKLAIIREFNRHGVDVTSEGLTAPFCGPITEFWHCWQKREEVLPGDERIPFIPFIYHGHVGYGNGTPSPTQAQDSALYGARHPVDWTKHADSHEIAYNLYLIVIPWTFLRDREMRGYAAVGERCRVEYDDDTFVEVDYGTREWQVVVDGRTLLRNGVVSVARDGLLALFSRDATRATFELPPDLRARRLTAMNTVTGGDVTATVEFRDDQVTLDLPACEPILLR